MQSMQVLIFYSRHLAKCLEQKRYKQLDEGFSRFLMTTPEMLVLPSIHYFRERISVQPYSRLLFVYVIHKVILFHQISTPFENKMSKYVHAIPEFGRQRQDRYHTLDEPGLHIEFQVSHGYLAKPCLKKWGKGRGRDDSVVKETCCSCRRPRFGSSPPT